MKTRSLMLFLLSLVFALGAGWVAYNWLSNQQQVQKVTVDEGTALSQVVVASRDMSPGINIDASFVELKEIDARLVPPGALLTLEEATGMAVKNNLYRGDVLRLERLTPIGQGSTLSVLLEPGMRAVTVRVNDVIGVAGFLLPGNRVDILSTDNSMTRTVLTNLKVLAVDQTQHTDENRPKLVRAVTLEVDPEQAERLVNASANGQIQLALRNPNDKPESAEITAALPPQSAPQKPVKSVPRAAPRPASVDVIKGSSLQQIPVKS
ncbi:Flp pilus assembly protein CpaB [Oceanisphaera profunda]|uniref:Flp pilus assembly protein CpaB n=1 Tax=Oceanisphaera profunda TaxID=1416627 RepID=A0A1Y0D8Y5_9GAMM|nr:Flp pilus assembly protein CpaB [Oceanisphaera profunda]ART83647.1 Flp pilus assembly protein CpaB [Oceanisphaera profunda]